MGLDQATAAPGGATEALGTWLAEYVGVSGRSRESSRSNATHVRDTLVTVAAQTGVPADALPLDAVTRDRLVQAILDYRTRPDRRFKQTTLSAAPQRSDASVRRRISALRTFFAWCAKTGKLATDPMLGIPAPRADRPPPKALDEAEARRLLQVAGASFWPQRDTLIVWLGLGSGLRLSEAAGVRLERLLGNPPTHLRVTGKGNKTRDVPLMPPIVEALDAYLPTRQAMLERWEGDVDPSCPWLLLARRPYVLRGVTGIDGQPVRDIRLTSHGIARRADQLMKAAGLRAPGKLVHSWRHTFATLALQSGSHNVRELQEQLGHADLGTVMTYTKVSSEELRQAALRHPLAQ